MHQMKIDAKELFGANAAAAEWIKDPSYKYPKTDLVNVNSKLLGRRERNVNCLMLHAAIGQAKGFVLSTIELLIWVVCAIYVW